MGRMRSTSVTLTEVARAAGVSLATASKALNARDEVAPDTRRRVLRAAAELSFRPNALAKGLVSGRTHTVGLLIDELAERFAFPVLLGAENALGDEQNSVLLCEPGATQSAAGITSRPCWPGRSTACSCSAATTTIGRR